MIRINRTLLLSLTLMIAVFALACSSSDSDESGERRSSRNSSAFAGKDGLQGPPGLPGLPGVQGPAGPPGGAAPDNSGGFGFAPQPSQPTAFPTAAPAATPAPSIPRSPINPVFGVTLDADDNSAVEEQVASLVAQQRIIVRTVDMGLVVDNVASSLDDISGLAQEFGGWVVSSDRSQKHQGSVSLRVPAERLDEAITRLRQLAVEVDSEVTTSKDVTDEFVDTNARLGNLQATQQALVKLLDEAKNVTEALSVQTELTKVQEEIERLQGRIKFLEETAAFSLINVRLRLSPIEMTIDAGPDQTFSVGQFARFRATFQPPEGIDNFVFTWDFGDGTDQVTGSGTSTSALSEGRRTTGTVTHLYNDDRDSPFIVEVKITGTGDAGVAEGMDTFIATVTRIPTVEVFAGESRSVEEGEEVQFNGSFTRPAGLENLTFTWDFGDGTPPVEGSPAEGSTNASATHVYSDHRPFSYAATLTIKADSDAGPVEASSQLSVFVTESEGWVIAGWDGGETGRDAVRALSGVGQGAATFFIWLGIFSPIWIILIILIVVIRLRRRRNAYSP